MANMNFGVNLLPKTDNTYSLGYDDGNSNQKRWNLYANQIYGESLSVNSSEMSAVTITPTAISSSTNLNNLSNSFFFSGNSICPEISSDTTDWVGILIGYTNDKWQLTASENNLWFRQNENGGTNTSWQSWKRILDTSIIDTTISSTINQNHIPSTQAMINYIASNSPITGIVSQTSQVNLLGTTATTDNSLLLTSAYVTTAGALYSTTVHNAVWNDYAEYRAAASYIEPGRVVIDTDNGEVVLATKRLLPGAQVVSDTWGHIMGETNNAKTPIAVAGRVLVYPYKDRKEYHAGMCVCSAPNGTVDIMTKEEILKYPDCIIGIVSEIPNYDVWGSGNINVDGRIWIRIK